MRTRCSTGRRIARAAPLAGACRACATRGSPARGRGYGFHEDGLSRRTPWPRASRAAPPRRRRRTTIASPHEGRAMKPACPSVHPPPRHAACRRPRDPRRRGHAPRSRPARHAFAYPGFFLLLPLRSLRRAAMRGVARQPLRRWSASTIATMATRDGTPRWPGSTTCWTAKAWRADGEVWLHMLPAHAGLRCSSR